ncbi:MAG: hypothetical protein GY847_39265 [Proteobacteria bacterium]|nr:hypothetical protein [Pseudomonadota bacterium]
MREILLALGLTLAIGLVSVLALAPWRILFQVSIWFVGVGFVVGVPTGFIYHMQLYRMLKPRGELPKGWIWNPIQLNSRLLPGDRGRVLPWCYIGAAGFFAIIIGFILVATSMILAQTQGA